MIHEIEKSSAKEDLFQTLNIDRAFAACFLSSICLGALFLVAFNSVANWVRERPVSLKLAFENFLGFKQTFAYPVSSLSIIYGSFELLYMLSKLIFSLGVKTSKVLLNLSFVITSLQQLMRSNLVCCFGKDDIILAVTKHAEKNSTMNRLFTEKSAMPGGVNAEKYPNNCVVNLQKLRKPLSMAEGGRRKAVFAQRKYAKTFMNRWAQRKNADGYHVNFWQSPTMVEMINVHYYRKGLDRLVSNSDCEYLSN